MREYELAILFHPDLEMNLDPALDKVKKLLVETHGGEITKEDADGKKHMSYTIKGQDFAVYYYIDVKLPPEAPNKISAVLNISDEILRQSLVKKDDRQDKYAALRKEREEKIAAREAAAETSAETPADDKEEA